MPDIFNRTITLGPVISGDLLRVSFPNNQGGMLVQMVQIQQQRNIGVFMNIGDGKLVQMLTVPTPVSVALQGVVIQASDYKNFITAYGSGCTSSDLVINVTSPVCTSGQTITYTVKNARISRLAAAVSSDNYMFISQIELTGVALEVT